MLLAIIFTSYCNICVILEFYIRNTYEKNRPVKWVERALNCRIIVGMRCTSTTVIKPAHRELVRLLAEMAVKDHLRETERPRESREATANTHTNDKITNGD